MAAESVSAATREDIRRSFREEERRGEQTVSGLRLTALAIFYLNELINYHALEVVSGAFHRDISLLVGAWAVFAAVATYITFRRKSVFYPSLKYAFASLDVAFVTGLLMIGGGPKSPLFTLYYSSIVLSNLRYSRAFTVFNTLLCAAAFGFLCYWTGQTRPELLVPAPAAVIHVLSMLVTGLLCGYVVSRLKGVTTEFIAGFIRRQKVESAFSRYVSYQVAEKILQNMDSLENLKGQRRQVTVMMSDIRGFTPLCARLPPEEVVALLNDYFERLTTIIFRFEGTIDKFIGDAVLVVFGAPMDQPDAPLRAARCALAVQRAMAEYNEERGAQGRETVQMGLGLNAGEVVAGNVGSEQRLDYTVLGDTVNFTQRLCGAAGPGQILISESVHKAVAAHVEAKPLEPFKVKGKDELVQAYELLAER